VKPAGKLVVLVGKFGPGVQLEQNHLHTADSLFRVDVRGHAAAIVRRAQAAVLMQNHVDAAGMAGDGFIHTIVDHFLGQVVGPPGVGIHARSATDRVKPLEDLQGGRIVIPMVDAIGVEKLIGFDGNTSRYRYDYTTIPHFSI
jgi:hypothetical protein